MIKSKNILFSLVFLWVFIGVSCSNQKKEEAISISVRMPIPVITTGQHPFFVALDKGFYEEENLQLKIEQGSSELNPIKMVAAGSDDFGVLGGPDGIITARSKDLPLKIISIVHRNSNFPCLVTLESSGITKLEELQGKDVGFYYGHISTDVIRNLFNKKNIDVNEVNVGFDYNQLINGVLSAQWAFTVRAVLELPEKGVAINIIKPQDYGINTHGYTIFTTDKMIEDNPDVVEKFLRASYKGISYSLANPEEALSIIQKYNESLNMDFARKSQVGFDKVTSNSQDYPAGYLDSVMIKETYNRLLEEGVLAKEFKLRKVYNTSFFNAIHKKNIK